jgi:hypothetical protein
VKYERRRYLAGALQLSSNELDALVLYVCIRLVRQVSSGNAETMSRIADTITLSYYQLCVRRASRRMVTYISANVQCLADPGGRNTAHEDGKTVNVLGGSAAGGVNVASQAGLVVRVTDEEDTLDRIECGTSKLGHGVNGGCCTLRVSFKDETSVGVGLQSSVDLVDDLWLSVL